MSDEQAINLLDEAVEEENDDKFVQEGDDTYHFNEEDDEDDFNVSPGGFDNDDSSHGTFDESLKRAQLEDLRQEQNNAEIAESKQEIGLASLASRLPQAIPGLGQVGVGSDSSNTEEIKRLEAENTHLLARNLELQGRVSTLEKTQDLNSISSTEEQLSSLQFEVYDQKTGMLTKIKNLERENQNLQERKSLEGWRNIENALEVITAERDWLRDQLDEAMFEIPVDDHSSTQYHLNEHDGGQHTFPDRRQSSGFQHYNSSRCGNCEEMQKQIDTLTQHYTFDVTQKDAELGTKTGIIQEKNAELETKGTEARDMQIELNYFASEISRLDAERKGQDAKFNEAQKTIIRLENERDDLIRRLSKWKESLDASQGNLLQQNPAEELNDPQVSQAQAIEEGKKLEFLERSHTSILGLRDENFKALEDEREQLKKQIVDSRIKLAECLKRHPEATQNSTTDYDYAVEDFNKLQHEVVVERETRVKMVTELQNRLEKNRKEIFSLQEQVRRQGGTVENTLLGTPARVLTPSNADVDSEPKTTGDIVASVKLIACEQNIKRLEEAEVEYTVQIQKLKAQIRELKDAAKTRKRSRDEYEEGHTDRDCESKQTQTKSLLEEIDKFDSQAGATSTGVSSSLESCNENLEKKDRILNELHTVVEYLMAQVQAGGKNPYLPSGAEEGLKLALRDSRRVAPISHALRRWLLERDELLNEAYDVIELLTAQVEGFGLDADIPDGFTPLNPDRDQSGAPLSEGLKDWLFARDAAIRLMSDDIKQARTVEIPGLEASVKNLQSTLVLLESRVAGLPPTVAEMDAELQVLRPQASVIQTNEDKPTNISNRIAGLIAMNAGLQQQVDTIKGLLETEVTTQHPKEDDLSESERTFIKDLQNAHDKISALETANNTLRAEIWDLREHQEASNEDYESCIDTLEVDLETLRKKHEIDCIRDLQIVQKTNAELEAMNRDLQQQVEAKIKSLAEAVDITTDLQTYIAVIEEDLKILKEQRAGESERTRDLRVSHSTKTEVQQELTGSESLQERIAAQDITITELRNKFAGELQTSRLLQVWREQLTRVVAEKEDTIGKLEQQHTDHETQHQRLQSLLDEAQARIEGYITSDQIHERELAKANETNNAINANINELNSLIAQLEHTERGLHQQIAELTSTNAELDKQARATAASVAAQHVSMEKKPKRTGASSGSGSGRKGGCIGRNEMAALGAVEVETGGRAARRTRNKVVNYSEGIIGGRVRKQGGGQKNKISKVPVAKGPRKKSLVSDPGFVDDSDTEEEEDE